MTYTPTRAIDIADQQTVKVFVFELGGLSVEAKTEEEARQRLIEFISRIGIERLVSQSRVHVTDEHPF